MEEIVQRLDPFIVADILLPQAPKIAGPMVQDLLTYSKQLTFITGGVRDWAIQVAKKPGPLQEKLARRFLVSVTRDIQKEVDAVINLQNCVLNQTMADRYDETPTTATRFSL